MLPLSLIYGVFVVFSRMFLTSCKVLNFFCFNQNLVEKSRHIQLPRVLGADSTAIFFLIINYFKLRFFICLIYF